MATRFRPPGLVAPTITGFMEGWSGARGRRADDADQRAADAHDLQMADARQRMADEETAHAIIPQVLGGSPEMGAAIRESGLDDLRAFLKRAVEILGPGLEAVRDELTRRFPEAEEFVKETYPAAVHNARHDIPEHR